MKEQATTRKCLIDVAAIKDEERGRSIAALESIMTKTSMTHLHEIRTIVRSGYTYDPAKICNQSKSRVARIFITIHQQIV